MVGFRRGTGTTMDMPSHREQRTALATRACDAVFRRQFHPQVGRIQEEKGRDWEPSCLHLLILKYLYCSCKMFKRRWVHVEVWMSEKSYHPSKHTPTHTYTHMYALYDTVDMIHVMHAMQHRKRLRKGKRQGLQRVCDGCCS